MGSPQVVEEWLRHYAALNKGRFFGVSVKMMYKGWVQTLLQATDVIAFTQTVDGYVFVFVFFSEKKRLE